jgi:glyoxylase-like metal-dependent hydrolase (beta-lactamase superfamily II)
VPLTPEDAIQRSAEAGIHLLRIPTPFAVGRVNCYLLEDRPLTLVDTGPNSGKALDELQRQLETAGHAVEDLELIVITHQHLDHLGLVEVLAGRSGAEVAAIDVAVPFLENFGSDVEREDEFAALLMLRCGIPEDVVIALRSVSRSFRAWGARAEVTRPIHDGETLDVGERRLEVQHRPGHSPSDTLLWDRERRILLAADHLIAHISSNPLISRPLDGSSERPQALVTYIASLARTRELPAEIVLPGHGDPITNHRELIDERFAMHRRRAERLERLIREGPRSPYELAQEIWGNVAVTQAFLTLSEVIGHVDLLVNAGRVRETEGDDGIVRFEATDGGGELEIPEPPAAAERGEQRPRNRSGIGG